MSYFLFSSKLLKLEQSSLKVWILGVCWEGPADPYDETSALQNGNLRGLWGACVPCGLQAGRQAQTAQLVREISSSNGNVDPTNRVNRRPKTHDFPKPVVKSRKEESASWQHWANIPERWSLSGTAGSAILCNMLGLLLTECLDWFHVDLSHTLSLLQDCQTNCANPTCEWKQLGGAYWWILNYLSIKISTMWNFCRIASTK